MTNTFVMTNIRLVSQIMQLSYEVRKLIKLVIKSQNFDPNKHQLIKLTQSKNATNESGSECQKSEHRKVRTSKVFLG